jgi:hypothetical protein
MRIKYYERHESGQQNDGTEQSQENFEHADLHAGRDE